MGKRNYNNNNKGNRNNRNNGNNNSRTSDRGKASSTKDENFDRKSQDGRKKYLAAIAGGQNDPSWYSKLPSIFNKATNFSWYNQLGADMRWVEDIHPTVDSEYKQVPGLLVLDTFTGPGTTLDVNSPMSIAAITLYEYVRKSLNKPNPDYEAPDLMMYMYAVVDIYAQYCDIMRAVGIINMFDVDNLYTPRSLLRGIYGFSDSEINNIIANRANYLLAFDSLIYKASWLFLPTSFSIMERQAWLFSNIFKDGNRTKAQFYAHRKVVDWQFDEVTSDNGSMLIPRERNYANNTFEQMLGNFDMSIEAVRMSSSCRIMQSDLRKAFEGSSSWDLAASDPNYITPVVVSDEVLMQIENAIILPDLSNFNTESLWVTQDVNHGVITHGPTINFEDPEPEIEVAAGILLETKPIVNTHLESPSKDDIMVATRNLVSGKLDEHNDIAVYYASDFIVGAHMITSTNENDPGRLINFSSFIEESGLGMRTLAKYYAFDWAPRLFMYDAGEPIMVQPITEFDNYTVIDRLNLENLHKVANYSMWYSSELGNWASVTV